MGRQARKPKGAKVFVSDMEDERAVVGVPVGGVTLKCRLAKPRSATAKAVVPEVITMAGRYLPGSRQLARDPYFRSTEAEDAAHVAALVEFEQGQGAV